MHASHIEIKRLRLTNGNSKWMRCLPDQIKTTYQDIEKRLVHKFDAMSKRDVKSAMQYLFTFTVEFNQDLNRTEPQLFDPSTMSGCQDDVSVAFKTWDGLCKKYQWKERHKKRSGSILHQWMLVSASPRYCRVLCRYTSKLSPS